MGLPMYVSPSLSKRQLPPKQSQSPYEDPEYSGDYQNSRTSAFGNRRYFIRRPYASGEYSSVRGGFSNGFYGSSETNLTDQPPITEISEWLQPRNPGSQPPLQNEQLRPQRIRRSSSLPYNNLVQHIQRLGNLPNLHRTREQQIASSGLATRRGMQLQSAQLLQAAQAQQAAIRQAQQAAQQSSSNTSVSSNDEIRHGDLLEEMNDPNFNESSNAPRGENHVNHNVTTTSQPNSAVLDSVFRRVNIIRQLTQDNRAMRPGSRSHRSSSSHNRSSSTRTALTREDLIQRGIDIQPPLIRVAGPYISSTFPSDVPESLPSLPPLPRRLRHSVRRGNFTASYDSRSNFGEDFIDNYNSYIGHFLDDDSEASRILSPIPRRYEPTLATSFAVVSPNGMLIENRERVDVDGGTSNDNIVGREIQEGSASGEVC